MKFSYAMVLAFGFTFGLAHLADAQIVFSGDFAAGTGKVTIAQDLTWNITEDSNVVGIIFDEIAPDDGELDFVNGDPFLSYEVSMAENQTFDFVDNYGFTSVDITPNDGSFVLTGGGVHVNNGDTFTLHAGMYTFDANPGFNPIYNGYTFTGNAFLANSPFEQISDTISVGVPEPTSLTLLALGSLALTRSRRRRVG